MSHDSRLSEAEPGAAPAAIRFRLADSRPQNRDGA